MVTLEIPAEPQFLRLARLAAVDVGGWAGFSVDEADDLRIAIDELCYAVIGGANRMRLDYRIVDDAVLIEGCSDGELVHPASDVTHSILAAVVDECEVRSTDGHPCFQARKRVSPTT